MRISKKNIIVDIAIVDDDDYYNKLVSKAIENYVATRAESGSVIVNLKSYTKIDDFMDTAEDRPSILFVDYYLDNQQEIVQLLKAIKQKARSTKIVIISHERSFKTAVKPIFAGAHGYLHKGPKMEEEVHHHLDDLVQKLKISQY